MPDRVALELLLDLGSDGSALFYRLPQSKQMSILGALTAREQEAAGRGAARRREQSPPTPSTAQQVWARRWRNLFYQPGTNEELPWQSVVNDADADVEAVPSWVQLDEIEAHIKLGIVRGYFPRRQMVVPVAEVKWSSVDYNTVDSLREVPSASSFDTFVAHQNAVREHDDLMEAGGFPEIEDRVTESARLDYQLPGDEGSGDKWIVTPTRKYMIYSRVSGEARIDTASSSSDTKEWNTLAEAVEYMESLSGLDFGDPPDPDTGV